MKGCGTKQLAPQPFLLAAQVICGAADDMSNPAGTIL
jgi:hypothetical protein